MRPGFKVVLVNSWGDEISNEVVDSLIEARKVAIAIARYLEPGEAIQIVEV